MPFKLIEGYRIRFYSTEMQEQPHVHVLRGGSEAKIWIESVILQHNRGDNERELNCVIELVGKHQAALLEMWHEHFG